MFRYYSFVFKKKCFKGLFGICAAKAVFVLVLPFLLYFWPIQWLFKSCYKILLITCQAKKKKKSVMMPNSLEVENLKKEKPIGLYFFPFCIYSF